MKKNTKLPPPNSITTKEKKTKKQNEKTNLDPRQKQL